MAWFARNATSIEAAAAVVTAFVALAALLGVKWQVDAARLQAQEQGARDLYREHLALSVQYPQFADPGACPQFSQTEQTAYESYVEHLIYTAEETIAADPNWWPVISDALLPHTGYICESLTRDAALTEPVSRMLGKLAVNTCPKLPLCEQGQDP